MTHGSLFSGIGGFDLAASWLGWTNVFQCEKDAFCQRILKYHFPTTTLYGDIKETDFTKYRGTVDVISRGFPCQPFSVAGKRKGTSDDRFLWGEMLRAVREVEPAWVVAENVRGLLSQERGVVFERVCADLEAIGYEVQPLVVPACAVGAPHRRDRAWFIAHALENAVGNGRLQREVSEKGAEVRTQRNAGAGGAIGVCVQQGDAANAERERSGGLRNESQAQGTQGSHELFREQYSIPSWGNFPTQPPICGGDDGLPRILDGITFPKWRGESIKGFGNAIVPQVAYELFKAIEHAERSKNIEP